MSEHKVVMQKNGRYKTQRGDGIATFAVSEEGKVTIYENRTGDIVKDYHFEDSDPEIVRRVATLLFDCYRKAKELAGPDKEIEIRGHKYQLVEK